MTRRTTTAATVPPEKPSPLADAQALTPGGHRLLEAADPEDEGDADQRKNHPEHGPPTGERPDGPADSSR
jgi:hypothetical protein